tara:strand:+ start:1100 stop:1273 length:174 start_codon:yes stop_codon:yes gene_type:complete
MKTNIFDKWLSLKDVSEYTGLSSSTLHRAIQKGELKVSKKTGKNLFKKEWVDNFLGI